MTRTAAPPGSLVVEPPPMHPGQWEVLTDPARFKLCRYGRRWRKTGVGIVQALFGYHDEDGTKRPGAVDGGLIGWWVPSMTARYIASDWEPLKACADQIPGTRIEEANHRVILPSGGWVMVLTGDNVDSGRGLGLDGAVLDEAQLLHEQLWTDTIRSTLIDRRGWGMFLFTPPRTGSQWIKDLVVDHATARGWREFHGSTRDNPEIDREEFEDLVGDMPPLVRLCEIDAEWPTAGAGVFDRSWIQYWRPSDDGGGYLLGDERVPVEKCRRITSVDLAWSLEERADYTVASTWAVTPKRHLLLLDVVRDRFAPHTIPDVIRGVYNRWRPAYIVMERGTTQLEIVKSVKRQGLPIRDVKADGDKIARAAPAAARMEDGQVWFPRPAVLPKLAECEEEMVGFPASEHDDFVDTFAYVVAEVAKGGRVW